ncbi:hypothetical protein HUW51_19270 [Adhaeribacter swui]|uniref:Uncharacterized protein n=1 Tax=Adhaeribacter swui TaxID=2086471 RepID=A0A7G7GC79_9BACT|nr:hypothetical protein [Adhaeribacter swui]QNF34763.1 hypothetical protein HUW51_19270 [Adhaeribacter swui]
MIVYDQELVEKVYRSCENTYDHVLLPTENQNTFIVIVIDLLAKNIRGHYILNLDREYELK